MNHFTMTFRITPFFSRSLFTALLIISFAATVVVAGLPLNLWIRLLGSLFIIIWLVMVLREHCWHLDSSIRTAILRSDDSWLILFEGEEPIKADLLSGCLVQPWLTVLQFRIPDRRKKSLILLQDNVDKDVFRRLRVRLRNNA